MPEKHEVTSQFKAEYNMGMLDYERYHEILKELDLLRYEVLQFQYKKVIPFYAMLNTLYGNIKAVIYKTKKEDLDLKFKNIFNQIDWYGRKLPLPTKEKSIIKELIEIHDELLEIKQLAGLGFPFKRKISDNAKAKAALS